MVDILLATYNGGRFLREQLDSLLHSGQEDICLLIQDDGSEDDTAEILAAYAGAYPGKVRLVSGPVHEKGAKGNFMSLLCVSGSRYAMFCDQDDVWEADKVAVTLACMREGEAIYGQDCPLLVHTDLQVTDAALRIVAPSFLAYQKLDGTPALGRLLAQNSVTGCTVMMNRPLMELMKRADARDMLMHDWWAALCAAAMGKLLLVARPTIRYRQHGGNQLGATGFEAARDIKRAAKNGEDVRRRLNDTFRQAERFLDRYGDMLPPEKKKVIRRYACLPALPKAARMFALVRYRYTKKGLLRCLGQLYYC